MNSKRLDLAEAAKAENDELSGLLYENLRLASMNRSGLAVFLSIAQLCKQNLDLLTAFARIDRALSEAASCARKEHNQEALEALDRALEEARNMKAERNEIWRNVVGTWYESWLPRVGEANGRHFLHAVDDVKDHLPDRTSDMSYLIYRELNLPLGDWYAKVEIRRNSFAAQHHLPEKELPLSWKDLR